MKIPKEIDDLARGRKTEIYVPSKLLGEPWRYRIRFEGTVATFWGDTFVESFCVAPEFPKVNYAADGMGLWIWTLWWWLTHDEEVFREKANGGWRIEDLRAWEELEGKTRRIPVLNNQGLLIYYD